jgi:hypothetical protein
MKLSTPLPSDPHSLSQPPLALFVSLDTIFSLILSPPPL